jgi:hypothetical protein
MVQGALKSAAEQSQPNWNRRSSRTRVAEWPVTDPILQARYSLKTYAMAKCNRDGAGESEQAPAVLTGPGQRLALE